MGNKDVNKEWIERILRSGGVFVEVEDPIEFGKKEEPRATDPSIQSLREAVGKKFKDTFQSGSVITFTAWERFRYAAIKADNGYWFTTGDQGSIAKRMVWDELVETLQKGHVKDIRVATAFEKL